MQIVGDHAPLPVPTGGPFADRFRRKACLCNACAVFSLSLCNARCYLMHDEHIDSGSCVQIINGGVSSPLPSPPCWLHPQVGHNNKYKSPHIHLLSVRMLICLFPHALSHGYDPFLHPSSECQALKQAVTSIALKIHSQFA